MATGTASPVAPERGDGGRKTHYDLVIEQQLSRTRRRVKFVDLASVFMMMLGAVVMYLLLVVLVDHWVVELSTSVRFLSLGLLVAGLLLFALRWVVPLLLRPINPGYAAQAIEQCNPSLKNSLLNFLMFRREPTPTGRLVYRALQQRAALDLKQVNVDLAVDKSRLIYIGYGVAALMVLFGAYTILSPKDVFQTVRRIAIPWADIARPTRVSIEDVRPGDDQRVRGSLVDISAQVLGVDADESVTLYYTTADKQTVDQAVPLEATGQGQRYRGTIPVSTNGQPRGIQQSLTYRIQAGDATSRDYQLTMQHTPSITVEKIDYTYPDYMQTAARTVERDGEIRGIEGTQVTVHARANYPIRRAEIQFDPGETAPPAPRKMTVNGDRAEYTFTLVWIDANNNSEYNSYQLDFEPELGAADPYAATRPVEHKIMVTPDLPPEIAILTPRRLETDVPLNGKQLIELRAVDPDFGLTDVTVRASAEGRDEWIKTSQLAPGYLGQFTQQYELRPSQLGYQVGDRVTLWAEATDNCTQPNQSRTADYVLNIVAADPAGGGDRNDQNQAAQQEGSPEQSPTPAQEGPRDNSSDSSSGTEAGSEMSPDSAAADSESSPGGGGEQSQSGEENSGEKGSQESSEGSAGGAAQDSTQGEQKQGSQTGAGGETESGAGGEQGTQEGTAGGSSTSTQNNAQNSGSENSSDGTGQSSPNQSSPSDSQSGSGGSESAGAGSSGAQPSDGSRDGSPTDTPTADSQSRSGAGQSGDAPGAANKADHEGEAMERILDHIKRTTGKEPQTGESSPATGDNSNGDPNAGRRSENSTAGEGGQTTQNQAGQDSPSADQAARPADNAAQQSPGNSSAQSEEGPQGGRESQPQGLGKNDTPTSGAGDEGTRQNQPKNSETTETSQHEPTEGSDTNDSGLGDEGSPGSGRSSENDAGAPQSQRRNAERDKTTQENDSPASSEPMAPSTSRQQRDAQGDQGGTESGGGEEGGGQPAQQTGRDSPGTTTSSDQGNVGSPESGSADTAQRGGNKQPASDQTGSSGQQKGPGSQNQASSTGDQMSPDGAEPSTPQSPRESNDQAVSDQTTPGSERTSGGMSSGVPDGGGIAGSAPDGPAQSQVPLLEGDAAKLEYAEKATDLVLEHLRDQDQDPDPELLKSLNWTKEELRAFRDRWEALKRNAREHEGQAEADLEDALRSLGLRDTGPGIRRSHADNDSYRGLRDDAPQSRVPASILEQFNAYRKGAARGPRREG